MVYSFLQSLHFIQQSSMNTVFAQFRSGSKSPIFQSIFAQNQKLFLCLKLRLQIHQIFLNVIDFDLS